MSARGCLTNISILAGKSKTSSTLCPRGRPYSSPGSLPTAPSCGCSLPTAPPHSLRDSTPEGAPAQREPCLPLPRDIGHGSEGRPSARQGVSVSTPRDIPQSDTTRRRVRRGLAESTAGLSAGCFEGLLGSFRQIGLARLRPQGARGAHKARSAAGLAPRDSDLQRSSSVRKGELG